MIVDGSNDVIIEGNVASVTVSAPGITVTASNATIAMASIDGENSAVIVDENSRISAVKANGNGATISGAGEVNTVAANANNITVTTPKTSVTAAAGTTGIKAGTADVPAGTTGSVNSGSGGSGGGGGGGSPTVPISAIFVTGADTVVNGESLQLGVTVMPDNATNKTVTWSVASGPATIDATGLLTTTGVGSVTVKAVAKDGSLIETTKAITVTAPVETIAAKVDYAAVWNESKRTWYIKVSVPENNLDAAHIKSISTIKEAGAVPEHPTALKPDSDAVLWFGVAHADGATTLKAAGEYAYRAIRADDSEYIFSFTYTPASVTGVIIPVSAISVSPTTMPLTMGGATGTIIAAVRPANAVNKDVTWSSSDETVATVADGIVTPKSAGTAIITAASAADGEIKATCLVTVLDSSIEQDPGKTGGAVTVTVGGKTVTFDGTIAYYAADASPGTAAGNYVGVKVTAPTKMTDVNNTATLTIGSETYAAAEHWMDGANFFYFYPKVTAAGQTFTFVVKWDGTDATSDTFTIKIADTAALEPAPISLAAIAGVTVPEIGATPVSTIADTTEYTAMVKWSPADATFAALTEYTATITIEPKEGYTLTGVTANYFTVAGAKTTNAADLGVITAVFPAMVKSAGDLNAIRNHLGGSYIQVADIDLSGYANWTPIGSNTEQFSGNYDGNGYNIYNLMSSGTALVGLFGKVGGRIENVHLDTVSITGENYVGGLAGGIINATVINCCVTKCTISGTSGVGGLVGYNHKGIIEKCCTQGAVTTTKDAEDCEFVGGLVGRNIGSILKSSAAVNVSGVAVCTGGLVGNNGGGTIEKCYATGTVTSAADRVGGLVGDNRPFIKAASIIRESYATGKVTGAVSENTRGGLVGLNETGTIEKSYYDTDTTGQSDTHKGTPKTTAEMKQQVTFDNWDFSDSWAIDEGKAYPIFK